jgi:hypothetical protein
MTKKRCIVWGCYRAAHPKNANGFCKVCEEERLAAVRQARRELSCLRGIVERGVCLDCGARLYPRPGLVGWWRCGRFREKGRIQRDPGRPCGFQTFTD